MLQPAPDQRPGRLLDGQFLIDMKKKIIFIDIPGAGGDSVNQFFAEIVDPKRCVINFEKNSLWSTEEEKVKISADCDYFSGHVSYADLKDNLYLNDVNVFAFLRDPREQIIDYLEFIRSLSDPSLEGTLDKYPECIKRLSRKLFLVDFSNQDCVSSFIKNLDSEEFSVLDNPQTRYLRSCKNNKNVDSEDVLDAVKTLKSLNAFGLFGRMTSDLKLISNLFGIEQIGYFQAKEMNSSKKLLPDAFNPFICFDLNLYKLALRIKGDSLLNGLNLDCIVDDFSLSLDKVKKDSLHGWIKTKSNKQIEFPVSVFVNGDYVGDFLSNHYRWDLKEKFGLNCAFNFFVKSDLVVKSGDYISFVNSESGFVLREIKASSIAS